jgi:DNA-binding FadR family transcriptional regulator
MAPAITEGDPVTGRYVAGQDRPDKRAAQVARRIETDIIRRDWPVGESLGSERSLQDAYGVSRSVLREAVRLVEHHQVARMRPGPRGGLVVSAPDAAPATRAMVIYLEYLGTTIDELLEARMVLEPLAAELAADRIDEAGITRLRGILGEVPPDPAGCDVHVVLAEITDNPVLALFVDVLTRLTVRFTGASLGSAKATAETVERLTADHASTVEAVAGGDSARAKTLTEQHVRTATGWLQRQYRPGRRSGRLRRTGRPAAAGKRAEIVAAEIHEDIAAAGWPVDTVFGTEAELLERYEISRSVLREAVRLLEYHTVARMRRGPGGGLIVTEPQPEAIVDTIALYLEYRRPSRDDLRLVRDAIELSNVVTVVRRRTDADVAAFLAAQGTDTSETCRDYRQAGLAEFVFHADLADLAGNRVLKLFLRILVELFRRHWISTMPAMPGPGDAAGVHHAHVRIVEAIADGDASLAQHRFRRHLEALSSWWM